MPRPNYFGNTSKCLVDARLLGMGWYLPTPGRLRPTKCRLFRHPRLRDRLPHARILIHCRLFFTESTPSFSPPAALTATRCGGVSWAVFGCSPMRPSRLLVQPLFGLLRLDVRLPPSTAVVFLGVEGPSLLNDARAARGSRGAGGIKAPQKTPVILSRQHPRASLSAGAQ